MNLEELIEKISTMKKDLVEFGNNCYGVEEIQDRDYFMVMDFKESAYDSLAEIKNILCEIQGEIKGDN